MIGHDPNDPYYGYRVDMDQHPPEEEKPKPFNWWLVPAAVMFSLLCWAVIWW